jgi:hypothetical protein
MAQRRTFVFKPRKLKFFRITVFLTKYVNSKVSKEILHHVLSYVSCSQGCHYTVKSICHLLTSQLIFFPIIMAKACSSHDFRWRAAQDAASSREGQRSAVLCVRQYGFRGTVQQSGHEQRHLHTQVPRRQKDLHGKTWFTLQRQPCFSQQVVEHSPPSLKTSDHRSNRGQARVNFPSFFELQNV